MPNPDWRVPPISTTTGHWDSGLATDSRWSHARLCRDSTTAVIPHHFLDAENAFLTREEDPTHSLWAGCSEPSARTHNTNAATELSTRYGNSATLGQHKACPDRDDSERTRPVTTTSVSPSHDLSPLSPRLNTPTPPTTHRLHTSMTMSSFSGTHLRPSHNGRSHRSLWTLSNITARNSS